MKCRTNFIAFFTAALLLCTCSTVFGQRKDKIKIPTVSTKKAGPYIGFQKGKYNAIEFGGEFQYKKIKLMHPSTHGFRFGTNYDFQENVLGFDAAYWHQRARLGLTYGAILSHRTDFEESRLGVSPAMGFRLLQFHLQTGYTFYTRATYFDNYNTFWIALKFTLINQRDIKVRK
ncbi:MAG: hypothetical protein K0R65_2316 [Crocinitomicaceae bacterium]|jgi:hypothetical protein|nr:hypothetical protein [Crocinitomicaceae bacterium]